MFDINLIPTNNTFRMTNDKTRNLFYFNSLRSVENKVVLDVGAGTGILSAYALHHGAKFVYSVERGKQESIVANKILGENFDKNKFLVLNKDFWSKDIFTHFTHDINLMVSETLSHDVFGEGILKTWRHIKPHVANDFTCVPDQLQIDALVYKNPIEKFPWLKDKLMLIPENLLHQDFATSLNNMHKRLTNHTTQHLIDFQVDHMTNFDNKIENVTNLNFAKYQGEVITFEVTVDCPSLIVLSGKILSDSNILHLHDPNNKTHWNHGLALYFDKPGKYKVSYVENNSSWTYNLIN